MANSPSAPPVDDAPHPADISNVPARRYKPEALATQAERVAPKGETSSTAIAAREKAAVEARFVMAYHNPRDFDRARLRIMDACKRPGFAEAARYSKPIGAEKVHGLSIRFAEEARVLWGNMEASAYIVFDDDERRIYRVQATDLETNATESVDVLVEKFVERRSLGKDREKISQRENSQGQVVYKIRATEDEVTVKANALLSKARRNCILALVPADVKEEAEAEIVETQRTADAKAPDEARKRLFDAFWRLGIGPEQVSALLGKPVEQILPAELGMLRAYHTALKDGESTWAQIMEAHGKAVAKPKAGAPQSTGAMSKLRDAVKPKDAKDAKDEMEEIRRAEAEFAAEEDGLFGGKSRG